MGRVTYPLTEEAKLVARSLAQLWNEGKLAQDVNVKPGSPDRTQDTVSISGYIAKSASLRELNHYGLINFSNSRVLLLQELRNAVENEFEVSDYFLTLNAVGTIVHGNLEIKEGAIYQSAGTNQGNTIVNTGQLADKLEDLLGQEALQDFPDLQRAIIDLRGADEPTRRSKMGKVVQELGRCMEHLSNFGGTAVALSLIAKILGG